MGVDGLMSDQLFIEQNSQLITDILAEVQERTVAELYALKGSKTAEEFLVFIDGLDVGQIVVSKSKNAINLFEQTHGGMLQSIQGFAALSEDTLQTLINYNTQSLLSQLGDMAQIIKKEVVNGIISGAGRQSVLNAVRGQRSLRPDQVKTLIDTALNEYSRSVTKLMIDKMPKDTKYVYIGALDGKTRVACLEMMSAGELTKAEISLTFGSDVFTNGGGYNCRHKWEYSVQDKFGHDPECANKRLKDIEQKRKNRKTTAPRKSAKKNPYRPKLTKKSFISDMNLEEYSQYKEIAEAMSTGKISHGDFSKKLEQLLDEFNSKR